MPKKNLYYRIFMHIIYLQVYHSYILLICLFVARIF